MPYPLAPSGQFPIERVIEHLLNYPGLRDRPSPAGRRCAQAILPLLFEHALCQHYRRHRRRPPRIKSKVRD